MVQFEDIAQRAASPAFIRGAEASTSVPKSSRVASSTAASSRRRRSLGTRSAAIASAELGTAVADATCPRGRDAGVAGIVRKSTSSPMVG